MVDIKGLNKAEVLCALFNGSKTQGRNQQMIDSGLLEKPKDMSVNEAECILENIGEVKHFDYLKGKVMKIDISNDTFDSWGYNRDNGQNAAETIIANLK